MKIATWNVERLRHKKLLDEMLHSIDEVNADILVLTETDQQLHPKYRSCYATPRMAIYQPDIYVPTENRVSIYTNYPCVRQHSTYDANTALCVELETGKGNLIVYGTIIGVYGNRHQTFLPDLMKQMDDLRRLSKLGVAICFCGDFNCSFSDNYYFTAAGRAAILNGLMDCNLSLLTENQTECIDHIALTEGFVGSAEVKIAEWNQAKALSDHIGIVVSF